MDDNWDEGMKASVEELANAIQTPEEAIALRERLPVLKDALHNSSKLVAADTLLCEEQKGEQDNRL